MCEKNYYMTGNATCELCDEDGEGNLREGVVCHSVGNELATLEIEAGYYRTAPESREVYPCTLGESACPGGKRTGDELCAEGYEGPLCGRLVQGVCEVGKCVVVMAMLI